MEIIDKSSENKESIIIDFKTNDFKFKVPKGLDIGQISAFCLDQRAQGRLKEILQDLLEMYQKYTIRIIDEPFVKVNGEEISIKTKIFNDSIIEL